MGKLKHNLANRPDLEELLKQNSGLAFHYCKITAQWFKDFEEELRQIKQALESWEPKEGTIGSEKIRLLKQILGEN